MGGWRVDVKMTGTDTKPEGEGDFIPLEPSSDEDEGGVALPKVEKLEDEDEAGGVKINREDDDEPVAKKAKEEEDSDAALPLRPKPVRPKSRTVRNGRVSRWSPYSVPMR